MAQYSFIIPETCAQQNKINTKKRHADSIEYLEAKISKGTSKIIQLKISQDAACFQAGEKIKSLISKTKRQEQELLIYAKKYQGLKKEYLKEIGLRPDTVNKVIQMRANCHRQEDQYLRFSRTLQFYQNGSQYLSKCYQMIADIMKKQKEQFTNEENIYVTRIEGLQNSLNQAIESSKEMVKIWCKNKETLEDHINNLRNQNLTVNAEHAKIKIELGCLDAQNVSYELEISEQFNYNEFLQAELKLKENNIESDIAKLCVIMSNEHQERIAELMTELDGVKLLISNNDISIEKLTQDNNGLSKQLLEMEDSRKKYDIKIDTFKKENENKEQRYNNAFDQHNALKRKYEELCLDDVVEGIKITNDEKYHIGMEWLKSKAVFKENENKWIDIKTKSEVKIQQLNTQNKQLELNITERKREIENYAGVNNKLQGELSELKDTKEVKIEKCISDTRLQLLLQKSLEALKRENAELRMKNDEIENRHKIAKLNLNKLQAKYIKMRASEIRLAEENTDSAENKWNFQVTPGTMEKLTAVTESIQDCEKEIKLLKEQIATREIPTQEISPGDRSIDGSLENRLKLPKFFKHKHSTL